MPANYMFRCSSLNKYDTIGRKNIQCSRFGPYTVEGKRYCWQHLPQGANYEVD